MTRVVAHLSAAALAELREHGRLVIELRCRPDRSAEMEARVAELLAENPAATANAIYRELGGRRVDVLLAVRSVRAGQAGTSPVPSLEGAPSRFLASGYRGESG